MTIAILTGFAIGVIATATVISTVELDDLLHGTRIAAQPPPSPITPTATRTRPARSCGLPEGW
ncbi:MAG: hypothetical protein GEV07_03075 [Streptosporangiales bacterium]|nr:hypothetical protein [Streptosporangiales bacterium]